MSDQWRGLCEVPDTQLSLVTYWYSSDDLHGLTAVGSVDMNNGLYPSLMERMEAYLMTQFSTPGTVPPSLYSLHGKLKSQHDKGDKTGYRL